METGAEAPDGGVLAFRFHNQPWQEDYLEACDEFGIMTIDESPVYTDGNAMYAYNEDIFWLNAILLCPVRLNDSTLHLVRRLT